MNTTQYIQDAKNEFSKAMDYLHGEYIKLQTGRASAVLVEDIPVSVYGSDQPLKGLAQITIPEPRSIMIKPWDKSSLGAIESAITKYGNGMNPVNNGDTIAINLPTLTEERRKDLAKLVHKLAEDSRITVRQARQTAHQKFKDLASNDEITEDEKTGAEKKLQTEVDEANKKIDEMAKKKENEVMTV